MEHTTTGPIATPRVTGDHPDRDQRVRQLMDVIEVIAPIVESDGGTLRVDAVDVDTGDVHVVLAGACGSCAVSASTLEAGITRILIQRLDWVTAVHGAVDDSGSDLTGTGGWVPRH